MGFFDRIGRSIRAHLNHLVNQKQDPEKLLEQAVMDMQEELFHLRQGVAEAISTQKRTEREYNQAKYNAEEWYRRAQLALQKGDEYLAREALARRKTYQDTAEAIERHLQQQKAISKKLREDLQALESKIVEVKTKKDLYIARVRSAQASQKLVEMLQKNRAGGFVAAFEQMEDKVMELEAQSLAISELEVNELENQFSALENGGEIEGELQALKAQLSGSLPQFDDGKARLDGPEDGEIDR